MNGPDPVRQTFARNLAVVLGAALGARLAFIVLMPSAARSVDADHWFEVFELLDAGINPYEATTYLNWPPVWMQLIYVMGKAASALEVPFFRVLQVVLIAFESLVIAATLRLCMDLAPAARARRIVLWGLSLNPVAILLTCQHANFDVIVALWVVLFALSVIRFSASGQPFDWLAACLFLGLGIVTKTVPFALAPLLVYRWRTLPPRARWTGLALVVGPVLLGMSVIYTLAPAGVTANVLRYRSFAGWFGISGFLQVAGYSWLSGLHGQLFNLVLLGVMGAVVLHLTRRDDVSQRDLVLLAALILVLIPTLGPGYGPQYIQWFLPLLVGLYAAYDAHWRRVVATGAVIAGLTYLVEYALFPSHGQFLVHLTQGSETILTWSQSLSGRAGQTLIRLPLFVALLGLLVAGVRQLRRQESPRELLG